MVLIRACDWFMLFAVAFARNTLTHFVITLASGRPRRACTGALVAHYEQTVIERVYGHGYGCGGCTSVRLGRRMRALVHYEQTASNEGVCSPARLYRSCRRTASTPVHYEQTSSNEGVTGPTRPCRPCRPTGGTQSYGSSSSHPPRQAQASLQRQGLSLVPSTAEIELFRPPYDPT
jgi:hypothetical protein